MVFKHGPRCPFSVCAALRHFDKCNTAEVAFGFFWAQTYGDWQKAHPYSQRSFLEPISWLWGCPDSHIHGAFPTELPARNKRQPADIWRVTCGPWGGSVRSHPDESPVPWKQKKSLVSPHNWERMHGCRSCHTFWRYFAHQWTMKHIAL